MRSDYESYFVSHHNTFLLRLARRFQRILAKYSSFLLDRVVVQWLMHRLGSKGLGSSSSRDIVLCVLRKNHQLRHEFCLFTLKSITGNSVEMLRVGVGVGV